MEQTENPKVIFGLSPRATLINSIVLAMLAMVFWTTAFFSQIPYGTPFQNLPTDFKFEDNVPWYYDAPLTILALIMYSSWFEYKYQVKRGEFNFHTIRYGYLYPILSFVIIQLFAKAIAGILIILIRW